MERFSTKGIAERDRVGVVNEVVARHIAERRFEPVAGTDLEAEIVAVELPDRLVVGAGAYSPIIGRRTTDMLNDGRDAYLLALHSHDHELTVDGGRPIQVAAGEMTMISEAVRSQFRLPRTRVKVLSLCRRKLRELAPQVDFEALHHAPASVPELALIGGYADMMLENPPQGEKARRLAAGHLYDLVALVLDGMGRGGAARNLVGIRAARLEIIRKEIVDRRQDAGLDIAAVARRHGVTPRYIQQLFAAEGTTFSEVLRNSRLDLAARLLDGTAMPAKSISAIAFEAGFLDLSTFNRGFRRRFGMTPSDARADALRRRAC